MIVGVGARLRALGPLPDGALPRDAAELLAALPERPRVVP